MSNEKKETIIAFRAPRVLKELVKKFVELDMHMSPSDFYRDAARNKIRQDAPDLYRQFFASQKNQEEKAKE